MRILEIPAQGCARCGRKRFPCLLTWDAKCGLVKRWCAVPCATSYEPITRATARKEKR